MLQQEDDVPNSNQPQAPSRSAHAWALVRHRDAGIGFTRNSRAFPPGCWIGSL